MNRSERIANQWLYEDVSRKGNGKGRDYCIVDCRGAQEELIGIHGIDFDDGIPVLTDIVEEGII